MALHNVVDSDRLLACEGAAAAAGMHVSTGRPLRPHSAPDALHQPLRTAAAADGYNCSSIAAMSPARAALRTELFDLKRRLHRLAQPYATHFHWERKQCAEDERRARSFIASAIADDHEGVLRHLIEASEAAWFHQLVAARQHDALLPWCSGGCTYCCMHRLDWAAHVSDSWTSMNGQLVQHEVACRRSLEAGCMHELRSIHNFISAQGRYHQLLAAHEATVMAESMHVAAILHLHEQRAFEVMVSEKLHLLAAWHNQRRQDALVLREAAADQRCATANAVMGRAFAQLLHGYRVQESEQRRQLVSRASLEAVELSARMRNEHTLLLQSVWARENAAMLDELANLRTFKATTEAAQRQAEEDRAKAIKAEWVQELQDIKRLKKAGPPKANQPLPPCTRCGQVPAKDAYTHRIQECTERPVACLKCADVLPASRMEAHKDACPQRVVPCKTCSNFYKAQYLVSEHQQRCSQLQQFAAVLTHRPSHVRTLCLPPPLQPTDQQEAGVPSLMWPQSTFAPWMLPEGVAAEAHDAIDDGRYTLTHVASTPVATWWDVERVLAASNCGSDPTAKVPVTVVLSFPPSASSTEASSSRPEDHHSWRGATVHEAAVAVGTRIQAEQCAAGAPPTTDAIQMASTTAVSPFCCVLCADVPPIAAVDRMPVARCIPPHATLPTNAAGGGSAVCCHHVAAMEAVVGQDALQYCKPQLERKQGGGRPSSGKPSR